MQSRRFSGLPLIGVFAIIYVIAGKIGLMLASLHASASPVWPPAGIALAAILLLGNRVWPAIFIGAFLVNATTAGNIATSFAIATGTMLEALAGAWLVNQFEGGKNLCDLDGVPFHSARNSHGDFHSVRSRGVGNAPWLRAVR